MNDNLSVRMRFFQIKPRRNKSPLNFESSIPVPSAAFSEEPNPRELVLINGSIDMTL